MKLFVWNAQGAKNKSGLDKWELFWEQYILPNITNPQGEDVVGLLLESGWAPWVSSGTVRLNASYPLTTGVTYYDAKSAGQSKLCQYILGKRQAKAFWVPWVNNPDALRTNTRCSMGGVVLPVNANYKQDRYVMPGFLRPVVRLFVGKLCILLVHLISGKSTVAQQNIVQLMKSVSQMIPQSTPAIVVGDMNINILNQTIKTGKGSQILSAGTSTPTQKSGGQLDFAVLYQYSGNAQATIIGNTDFSASDHVVMMYSL